MAKLILEDCGELVHLIYLAPHVLIRITNRINTFTEAASNEYFRIC